MAHLSSTGNEVLKMTPKSSRLVSQLVSTHSWSRVPHSPQFQQESWVWCSLGPLGYLPVPEPIPMARGSAHSKWSGPRVCLLRRGGRVKCREHPPGRGQQVQGWRRILLWGAVCYIGYRVNFVVVLLKSTSLVISFYLLMLSIMVRNVSKKFFKNVGVPLGK